MHDASSWPRDSLPWVLMINIRKPKSSQPSSTYTQAYKQAYKKACMQDSVRVHNNLWRYSYWVFGKTTRSWECWNDIVQVHTNIGDFKVGLHGGHMQAPLLKNELWKILKKRWKYNYIGIAKPSICNTLTWHVSWYKDTKSVTLCEVVFNDNKVPVYLV